jgi:hypothetical protein
MWLPPLLKSELWVVGTSLSKYLKVIREANIPVCGGGLIRADSSLSHNSAFLSYWSQVTSISPAPPIALIGLSSCPDPPPNPI